jgi:hypothetical protein
MSKVSIELSAETGGFISGMAAAERSVASLTESMKKAEKEGRWEDYNRLQMQRDSLMTSTSGFKRDTQKLFNDPRYQTTTTSGATIFKIDQDTASALKDLNDNIKKLSVKYEDQINSGDYTAARETFANIQNEQREYHKTIERATEPTGVQAMAGVMKAIGLNNITSAINDGFSRWVGALDRSGIVNQYGSGDIWGGRIAEKRRQADLAGGILQSVLAIGGTALGFALTAGNPIGAMAGGTIGGGLGKAADSAFHIGPNEESTEAAYAGLWQQRSGQAMELSALMGDPNKVRDAFRTAADAAAEFGYSAEEGMDAMKEAARQGLSGKEAADIAGRAFDYERRTGADRGTLLGISTMSARYGAGDALGMGWAGLQASGMQPGQYNEYLRAMQRVMEEGISKGFVRSSEQVARNLTMLSQMTGNNPLWQGENGARRLSEMNAGLEGATELSSTSQIIAFRAAMNIAKKYGLGDSYIEGQKILESGLGGKYGVELFQETMRLNTSYEGGGREGIEERMRDQFNLNYTNADMLYKGYDPNMNESEIKALIDKSKGEPPPENSPELDAVKKIEEIKNLWTQTGIMKWDANFPDMLLAELRKAQEDVYKPKDTSGMSLAEIVKIRRQEYSNALDTGNSNLINQAWLSLEKANIAEESMARDTVYAQTGKMFDEAWGRREDKEVFEKVNSMVNSSLSSGNYRERAAALQFSKIIESMKETEKGAIEKYNKDDTWNQLGSATDIHGMIAILERIARNLEDIHISTEE